MRKIFWTKVLKNTFLNNIHALLFKEFSLKNKKMIIKQKNIIYSEIEDISSLDYIRDNSILFINKNFTFKNLKK